MEVAAENSVCACVCVCVRAECDVFPIDTLSKCAPPLSPLPTATATTGPRGRNKQSSDNGTSSCSPIRNRCGRRALERKKKENNPKWSQPVRLSDTRIFPSTARQPFLFRTVLCPCLSELVQSEDGALFSFQDVLETSTKPFDSSASGLLPSRPVLAQVVQVTGVHSHGTPSQCHPLMLPSEQSGIKTFRTNGCGPVSAAVQLSRSSSPVCN